MWVRRSRRGNDYQQRRLGCVDSRRSGPVPAAAQLFDVPERKRDGIQGAPEV